MKTSPQIFEKQSDLNDFMSHLPVPQGQVRVNGIDMGAEDMISEMKTLVPSLYNYLGVLSKGQGGLGNNKSVKRFIEAASGNVAEEGLRNYYMALEEIETEARGIFEMSGSEELAAQMSTARKKVSQFKVMKDTITQFKNKLSMRMMKVEERYEELSSVMRNQTKQLEKLLEPGNALALQTEIDNKHKFVQGLVKDMSRYCDLQIGYNTLMLTST